MNGWRRPLLIAAALAAAAPAPVAADDWGLTRERPRPAAKKKKPRTGGKRATAAPAGDRDEVLRERYLRVLLREPLERFALDRLLELYRKRDGNLDKLAAELAERSTGEPERAALWLLRGQVEAARGQLEPARESYVRAAELSPRAPGPLLLQADLAADAGEAERAEQLLEAARERTRGGAARDEITRRLAGMALDRRDFELAEQRYAKLQASARGAVYRTSELARALADRGHHARAADAYARAAEQLRGDNRVLPPVLLELARAQLDAGRVDESLATLSRARKLAGGAAGIRYAIDELRVEVHRRAGKLDALADELARERGARFERLELLGRVLDELGRHDEAIDTLRRALAIRPRDGDARQRLIRILTGRGELKAAIAEYRKLIAASPRQPRYLLELAQLLMESGARAEALQLLAQASQRNPRDASLHRALHDVYTRWGERERATKVLQKLARIEPRDPVHLVTLGEQQLEAGNQSAALATWRRILKVTPDRAAGHAALAGTYMDHDMPERALAEWEAAVRLAPRELRYIRGLAEVLERLHRPADAIRQWERVLELEQDDRLVRREARRRLARLWGGTGRLGPEIQRLEKAFQWGAYRKGRKGQQPDVEAGRMLAEAYAVLGRGRGRRKGEPRYLRAAESVLERVIALAPGDLDSMLALERARTTRGDPEGAIAVLQKLVEADPKNARSYLARMAEHALALYRDDDAVRYAERSVALNPDDAIAQRRLGDLYRARQRNQRAIESYRRAIELDERAYPVYFQLAELHLAAGQTEQADALLRDVMRASPDDDLVKRATRSLLQLHLGAGTLASLEQTLLPLALAHTRRPVYRTLLIELYEAIARPLIDAARGHGEPAERAREELAALGRRAIKPLLEALADDEPNQRRIAIELLGHVDNDSAALPLLRVAESDAPTAQRRSALLAAGAVAPDALAPRFAALTGVRERRLQEAAAWALCRMAGPRALPHLRALAVDSAPVLRGLAMLGLGRAGDRPSLARRREAARRDRSAWVRGMALLSLGAQRDGEAAALLATAATAERGDVARAAVVALGAVGDARAVPALADLVFQPQAELRMAALWALGWLAAGQPPPAPAELPAPAARARLRVFVAGWLGSTPSAPADGADAPPAVDAADALLPFAPELAEAARAALGGSRRSALSALSLLSPPSPLGGEDGRTRAELLRLLRPQLEPLSEHPEADVRAAAVRLLGGGADRAALLAALADGDERVRSAALEALGAADGGQPALASTIASIARQDARWWMRQRAVEALGRLGVPGAVAVLDQVVRGEPFAYVREAAVTALERAAQSKHCAGGQECARHAALESLRAAMNDGEPRVRAAARAAIERLTADAPHD